MRNKTIAALSLSIFILLAPVAAQEKKEQGSHYQEKSQKDCYEQGNALRAKGEWEQALKTWWEGFNALESNGVADPRIGVAFIELATEMKAEKYYGIVCDLYLKSLSSQGSKDHRAVVSQEFLAISPFLEQEEYESLKLVLASGDVSKIANRIRQFWEKKDPTPATPGNERLISHWLRIAYAKRNFAENRSSVYATDDRGVVYVVYGEPARRIWGRLGAQSDTEVTENRENNNPAYEIWAYREAKSEGWLAIMFRRIDNTDSYEIVAGVEDFIEGFDHENKDNRNLLTRYYSDLDDIDPFVGSGFREHRNYSDSEDWGIHRREREEDQRMMRAILDRAKKRESSVQK